MGIIKNNIHKIYLSIIVLLMSLLFIKTDIITVTKNDGVMSVNIVYGNGTPNSTKKN